MAATQRLDSWKRRDILQLALASPLALASLPARADRANVEDRLSRYLEGLRQPDGGYGWGDFPRAHLTPTFAAVGCYRLLGQKPPEPACVAEYVRAHHPFAIKHLSRPLKTFEFQQIQALLWLEESADFLRDRIAGWRKPIEFNHYYERHGYPVFEYEVAPVVCRKLLGMPTSDLSEEMITYIDARRRENGSFNNTPADDGADGHVVNTWWGLRTLQALGRGDEGREATVAWVRRCLRDDGSASWQPEPIFAGNADVYYLRAALRILEHCDAEPNHPEKCVEWLLRLRNDDGGFAARPGWVSNPVATFYAVDALAALGALGELRSQTTSSRPAAQAKSPETLRVYSAQIEAHGTGSPVEAVELARTLKLHLWGAKNAEPGWIEAAQAEAKRRAVEVTFFVSNEEYDTWVTVPGQGTYSHTSDLVAPAGREIGESLAGKGPVSWPEFRERRVAPLRAGDGRLVWQFGENEPLTRLYLDDSVARGGYAAISTFHFGNPDFTNSSPFLKQYRREIPFTALQDAHGPQAWWWGDQLTGFRTLFLAREATWEAWLEALAANRTVAVRRDEDSDWQTWMHGSAESIALAEQQWQRWRWWDNSDLNRPLVSLVALRPDMPFETARPEKGVTLRVRCQWENTSMGRPKRPRVELKRLLLDGQRVPARLEAPKRNGRLRDHYWAHHIDQLSPGTHTATAVIVRRGSDEEIENTIEFAESMP